MKSLLIRLAVIGVVAALPGCTRHAREAAYGAPVTDITRTSTEPGTYGARSPYHVISETRDRQHVVVDVNVTDLGKVDEVARKVVADKKGEANAVTVHVYASDQKPPKAPVRTLEWTADKGFSS